MGVDFFKNLNKGWNVIGVVSCDLQWVCWSEGFLEEALDLGIISLGVWTIFLFIISSAGANISSSSAESKTGDREESRFSLAIAIFLCGLFSGGMESVSFKLT